MAFNTRQSDRFSMGTADNTIKDIWQYSQKDHPDEFNPEAMNRDVDRRRQIRQEAGVDRLSLGLGPSPIVRDEVQSKTFKRRSTNVNVQKSLQLLDDAVGTPGSFLKSAKKAQLRHSLYAPKPVPPSGSKFDVSATLGATPSRSMLSESNRSILGESSINMTVPAMTPLKGPQSLLEPMTPFGDEVTTTNVALLLDEDPGVAASSGLYGDFLESRVSNPSENQIFDLVNCYTTLCRDQVLLLKKLVKRATPGQSKFAKTLNVLNLLQQEQKTWQLVGSLYRDRLESEARCEEEPIEIDRLDKYVSEKQLADKLFEKDDSLRQSQLVVDWLEQIAAPDLEYHREKVEYFTDNAVSWENTLHTLLKQSEGAPFAMQRPIVNQMDPDAPVRQNRPLADLDKEDEIRLLTYMFAYIRTGQLDEAQRLCSKCGQAWRAATLEGWRLHHDPNYESLGPGGEVAAMTGNPYRDVWKAVCWRMAEEDQYHAYERACYAALSGNLPQLLPVCDTWEDYLWAYFKCMVDTKVEQEIRINTTSERSLVKLPAAYWDKMLTPDAIFKEIQASGNDNVRAESMDCFHLIQKYLILGNIDGLIEEMYSWVKDTSNRPSQHLIRFMAHLILFLRTIGKTTKEELCIAILETYVRDLIEQKQIPLIASYVATLPVGLQVEWYAKFLEDIHDQSERQQCLQLAENSDLDIPSITKLVVENIRNRNVTEFSIDTDTALEAATSEEDRFKIEAIDWLVFDQSQRAEAVRQANAVMRTFLAVKKHAAARDVFNKIPGGSVDVIYKNWQRQAGSTDLPSEDSNAIREYLCIQAYLDALDSFNDWFEHFHNSKPAKPSIPQGSNFAERVAFEHREKQYEAELERWQHALLMQTKTCKERIYNVLMFVDGGWMVDPRQDGESDESRAHQMRLLRQLCLPTMCFLLHSVLHSTQQYRECLQLADVIASEQHQLYKVFRKDELQKLLQLLRDSSISLLDKNLDPLGSEIN